VAGLRSDARRISELVQAVKDYSRRDRAPEEDVDVRAALESTLTMLDHRLKQGTVRVERLYAEGLRGCLHGRASSTRSSRTSSSTNWTPSPARGR